jgi:hypothetical protein
MLTRQKVSCSGSSMEGKSMQFAALEPQHGENARYQETYSNYRLEIPERKHWRRGNMRSRFLRVRLILPRMKFRFLSPMHLCEKLRDSYCRIVLSNRRPEYHVVSPIQEFSFTSNAIADCIEFVKQSSVSQEAIILHPSA